MGLQSPDPRFESGRRLRASAARGGLAGTGARRGEAPEDRLPALAAGAAAIARLLRVLAVIPGGCDAGSRERRRLVVVGHELLGREVGLARRARIPVRWREELRELADPRALLAELGTAFEVAQELLAPS